MGMYNQIVEVESNVVKITTGGLEKEYNKTDLKCSATDIMVFLYYYTDSKNQIVASWNAYQADLYGYTLSSLKSYIDGLLSSSKANLSNINLGSVGEFATQADAIAGGLKNGDVYRLPKNADNRMLAIVNAIIESYTAGTSTIDFTNNGGDDWDISFLATPTTVQSSANITGYAYDVNFWSSGVSTSLDGGFKTTNYTYNAVNKGAGVYQVSQTFVFDDNSIFRVASLYKVNSIGVVVAFVSANGVSVNNTNGLIINATAHYTEYGVSYPLIRASYNNYPPSSLNVLGNTTTINANVPIDSIGIGYFPALDSVFTDDYAGNTGSVASIVIS